MQRMAPWCIVHGLQHNRAVSRRNALDPEFRLANRGCPTRVDTSPAEEIEHDNGIFLKIPNFFQPSPGEIEPDGVRNRPCGLSDCLSVRPANYSGTTSNIRQRSRALRSTIPALCETGPKRWLDPRRAVPAMTTSGSDQESASQTPVPGSRDPLSNDRLVVYRGVHVTDGCHANLTRWLPPRSGCSPW